MKSLAFALTLMAVPAMAQAPAAVWPTRDVVVSFNGPPQMGGQPMRMSFAGGGDLARMDMGPQGYGIIDRKAKRMTMVMPEQRMFMVLTVPEGMPVSTDVADHSFTRVGNRTVAGVSCTDWRVQAKANASHQAIVCITNDGVTLRTQAQPESANSFVMEATEVRYGALDAGLFRVPEGFTRMEMPAGTPRRR